MILNSKNIENYLSILKFHQKAGQRDVNILAGISLVLFIVSFAFGMLDQISGRSLYIVGAILIVLGFSSLMAWVKLQITNASIEVMENLTR